MKRTLLLGGLAILVAACRDDQAGRSTEIPDIDPPSQARANELGQDVKQGLEQARQNAQELARDVDEAIERAGARLANATADERKQFVKETRQTLRSIEGEIDRIGADTRRAYGAVERDLRAAAERVDARLDEVETAAGRAYAEAASAVRDDLRQLRRTIDRADEQGLF